MLLLSILPVLSLAQICIVPDTREPLSTCNMVDYPVFLRSGTDLHPLDHDASLLWQDITTDTNVKQTQDCANSMRGFACMSTLKACATGTTPRPLEPCRQACEAYADICYTSARAATFKSSTCSKFPTNSCTRVAMPSPPPVLITRDAVLFNETVNAGWAVGNVNFGAHSLYLPSVVMDAKITTRGAILTVEVTNGVIDAAIGYWFEQKSFPWLRDSGVVHAFIDRFTCRVTYTFNSRTKKWETSSTVSMPVRLQMFDTSLAWLRNLLLSWWVPALTPVLQAVIRSKALGYIGDNLSFNMGMYGLEHPDSRLDAALTWNFTNLY